MVFRLNVMIRKGVFYMTFILVDDSQKCNDCVYWTGMRNKATDIAYVDLNPVEWGICLHPNAVSYGQPTGSCEGCSWCITSKAIV